MRPTRVCKTEPMKPPQAEVLLCGIRGEEPRGPKGLKCAGNNRGASGTPGPVGWTQGVVTRPARSRARGLKCEDE